MSSDPASTNAPSDAVNIGTAPVIRVHGVGKRYRIWNSPAARLQAFACGTVGTFLPARSGLHQRLENTVHSRYRDFEALKGIDFEVGSGEAVAIIGRNGSGKSTLLQIIAGTLQPSEGEVEVRGKVAALLELGSAFHPQFTGRENVYLYGSILGEPSSRIDELFDEIAAFADIGEFLDQPVKTYSSGMMLRLAFAVQTAIAPEILIVDEALAVGDIFFQAKCMRRIRRMRETGTTLLFVSHGMSSVRELCPRAILLDHGRLVIDANSGAATQRYLALQLNLDSTQQGHTLSALDELENGAGSSESEVTLEHVEEADKPLWPLSGLTAGADAFTKKASDERICSDKAVFINVQLLDSKGTPNDTFDFGEESTCRMVIRLDAYIPNLWVGFHIRTTSGVDIVHCDMNLAGRLGYKFEPENTYVLDWHLSMRLQHGAYYITCVMAKPDQPYVMRPNWEYLDVVNHAYDFSVAPRETGMIGGFVAMNPDLAIQVVPRTSLNQN